MLNTQESRDGATACFDAMKIIEHIATNGAGEWSIDECFKAQRLAISSAVISAGEVSARAQGVIAAMAEYIYSCNAAGLPNLDIWRPEATMTDQEIAENMARYIEISES